MTFPMSLIREDLAAFGGYSSARTSFDGPPATIWLNANEASSANVADPDGRTRRYPQPQPDALRTALSAYLGADYEQLLIARGSDEAIDVLIRTVCAPGGDRGIITCSPTFGMYAVSAAVHGVPAHDVPQHDTSTGFEHDLEAVATAVRATGARIVFLASPGNPTGSVIDLYDVLALADDIADVAMVVLDEAYVEFADEGSAIAAVAAHPTLAVLRTMSKAHGLAGARIGALIAHPDLVSVMRRVQAPYPLPTPAVDVAIEALSPASLADTAIRVDATVELRDRLAQIVTQARGVTCVYDSQANFVLARTSAPDRLIDAVRHQGIAIRDMRHLPGLSDAVRISVGTSDDLDALAHALHPLTTPERNS